MYMQRCKMISTTISTQSKLICPLDDSLKFTVVPPSSQFYVVSGHVSMTMVGIVTQLIVSTAWSAFWRSRRLLSGSSRFITSINKTCQFIESIEQQFLMAAPAWQMFCALPQDLLVVWPISHQEFQGLERFLWALTFSTCFNWLQLT